MDHTDHFGFQLKGDFDTRVCKFQSKHRRDRVTRYQTKNLEEKTIVDFVNNKNHKIILFP